MAPTVGGDYSLDASSPGTAANSACGVQVGPEGEGCAVVGAGSAERARPRHLALRAIGSNPFRVRARVGLEVPDHTQVVLAVYDVGGRRVRLLMEGSLAPGRYTATWDGTDGSGRAAAAGVYFVRLQAGGGSASAKVVYLR
jgi:hypothetical protein